LEKEHKNKKVVLINNRDIENIPKYMFDLIEIFGVKHSDIIILDKTTRFKSVCVPMQSFNTRVYTSDSFAKTFDKMAANVPDEEIYDKIYVSRAKLDDAHKTLGEEKVQAVFEKNGFKIIYPEKLPLVSQIALVKNCKVLAGCAGTALHLALFMKPGGTVISIKRNRRPACNAMIQNNINNTKQLNGVFISGSVESHKTGHSTHVPQIIGINKYMRQFFADNKFKLCDDDLKFDESAWNEYMTAYREYKKQHGGLFAKEIKRYLIKYTALLIPGRERRGKWRAFWKEKLN
jgi:capsular polysaccharide biosynthesis protein